MQRDFPFLASGLAYLDNASTAQKPTMVLDAMTDYYENYCANVHRGLYRTSEEATSRYEAVREAVARFIGAASEREVIFTSGTTHALNLVARLVAQDLQPGDEIVLTRLEHHANLIPWQLVARERGAVLKFLETNDDDELEVGALEPLLSDRTRVLSLTHISNASGYIAPVRELAAAAKQQNPGIVVIVDAAQSVPHLPVDVQDLGVDFLTFSGHKLCGPTGVGVLWGRLPLLEKYEPVFGGGSMIKEVGLTSSTWADVPQKFEPGTPNIAGVIGLGAAIAYLETIGLEAIHAAVTELTGYALDTLGGLAGVRIYGPANRAVHAGIISFTVAGVHPHDLASVLDDAQIAVRAGHHCAQPLMKRWGVPATTRASLYFYNTRADIDRLAAGIQQAQKLLAR
jgi:cysteine desulfurase/selenocysteine lyase